MEFRKKLVFSLAVSIGILSINFSTVAKAQQQKQIMGRLEVAWVMPGKIRVKAKLDSGAKTTSINAKNISVFERKKLRWVRFQIRDAKKNTYSFERKLVRIARIKRHKETSVERPVVMLGICMGGLYVEEEVNLENRIGFNYQLLIGRNFMIGRIVIDPELAYTKEPKCESKSAG